MVFARLVQSKVSQLEGRKLLKESVEMLLGVSPEITSVLSQYLRINSIYDLAVSRAFNAARQLVDASGIIETEALNHDFVPGDALWSHPSNFKPLTVGGLDLNELVFSPSDQEQSKTIAQKISDALTIKSIREFAFWPPFQNARYIQLSTFNPNKVNEDDPESPVDLLPKNGNYATERVYYNSVFLTEIQQDDQLTSLGQTSGAIDLSAAVTPWYDRPAYGVLLRTEQAWYAQGVTLGQLLNSIALAPGESTKIAIVDWTRRTLGVGTDAIDEGESMSVSGDQRRSITEVTDAIAKETQTGSSTMQSGSASSSNADSFASALLVSSAGFSTSSSINRGFATNVSRSSGTRDLFAKNSQDISARTEQHATSVRSRRASVVKETFEQENQKVTTRVITNYNHMHALSIQYYEVVQSYRVVTRANRVERVLFIPIKPMVFNPDIVARYRQPLASAAVDIVSRNEILKFQKNAVATLTPINRERSTNQSPNPQYVLLDGPYDDTSGGRLKSLRIQIGVPKDQPQARITHINGTTEVFDFENVGDGIEWTADFQQGIRLDDISKIELLIPYGESESENAPAWALYRIEGLGTKLDLYQAIALSEGWLHSTRHIIQPDESLLDISKKYGISADQLCATNMEGEAILALKSGRASDKDLINMTTKAKTNPTEKIYSLIPNAQTGQLFLWIPIPNASDGNSAFPVLQVSTYAPNSSLIDHLNDYALYYSLAILAADDSFLLNRVLAGYNIVDPYPDPGTGGNNNPDRQPVLRPLSVCVDPSPVAMTGNYLGFVWHFESEEARQQWMEQNRFHEGQDESETMVSLSSGGIFAEAVQGRFNSAEKLDITRFWNWQDSPIPIVPPDIAPIQVDSRKGSVSTDTGTLGASVIQLPALQALPDPTGTGAALQALTTANMFRDMSGQAEVSAALQKSVEMSASGDQHAAEQAQKAMASLLEHQQKMARTAVDAAKAAKDLEPSLSKENPSVKGALMNEAAKDDAALASTAPTSPSLPQQSAAPVSPNPAKSMPFKTAAYSAVVKELEGVLKDQGKWQQDGSDTPSTEGTTMEQP